MLNPIILAVPELPSEMPMPQRVASLSRHARTAVQISARRSSLKISDRWPKDRDGSPLPDKGIFWSLTHKPRFVAGVVSRGRIGIDLERIKPRHTRALFKKTAGDSEWHLAPVKDWLHFYRYWTAKEAVLKAAGIGLKGLSGCRVIAISDERHLKIHYRNRVWQVEHLFFDEHIASLVHQDKAVRWSVLKDVPIRMGDRTVSRHDRPDGP